MALFRVWLFESVKVGWLSWFLSDIKVVLVYRSVSCIGVHPAWGLQVGVGVGVGGAR